jgi:hypothetical protein
MEGSDLGEECEEGEASEGSLQRAGGRISSRGCKLGGQRETEAEGSLVDFGGKL